MPHTFNDTDAMHMAHAIRIAKYGCYSVTPNPSVGCVLVSESGEVIAEGFHKKSGGPHAEIHALSQVNKQAPNTTAYVTLEPCSHHGRTGPCAQALIDAGVQQVIIAGSDPNPKVAGNGIKMLEAAGITVRSGLMKDEAEKLNIGFFTRMRSHRPFVRLKLACSLDGKTALHNGVSQWITSEQARRDVQRERAQSCAILSGSGTVLADNPRLNVRPDELSDKAREGFLWRKAQPLRVIVDGKNQLHDALNLIQDCHATRIYNTQFNESLAFEHVSQVQLASSNNERHIDLQRMLVDLAKQDINTVWVEGGAKLAGALLDANLVDELVLYMAPKILGGGAMELVKTERKHSLQEAVQMHISELEQIGPDLKLVCPLA